MKTIHNEKIKTVTFLDERFYFDEKTKEYYPSSTTILDVYPKGYGYYKWLKDMGSNAEQVLKEAGEQGTLIHNAIQDFLDGKDINWADEKGEAQYTLLQWKMLMRFYDFYKTYKPEVINFEVSLVDPKLGYGGTIDFIGKIKGETWLIDWKSGSGVYKSHELQIASYARLWNKSFPIYKIDRFGILHLKASTRGAGKNGAIQGEGWKLHEPKDDLNRLFDFFEMTRQIWLKENPNPKPKNMIYPDRISMKELEVKKTT